MSATSHLVFVGAAPGLEALLSRELTALGFRNAVKEGGVELRASTEELQRLCVHTALGESVRVRLKSFVARDFESLVEGLGRLPWRAYLSAGERVAVKVTCHRSRLYHSGAVAERVQAVLTERVKTVSAQTHAEGEIDEVEELGATTLYVRVTGDAVQVSVDASYARLHRRGYRTHVERASLRETLAAALLQSARELYPNESPRDLWDPFCGAGTIGLEALRWAQGVLPGSARRFAFERWPTHDAAGFQALRVSWVEEARNRARLPELVVWGSDLSARAITAARHNAEAARIQTEQLRLLEGDFEQVAREVPRGAWVVSNPPYGGRLEERGVIERLWRLLRRRADLRPVVLLVGAEARRALPAEFRVLTQTKNGGLDVAVRGLTASGRS